VGLQYAVPQTQFRALLSSCPLARTAEHCQTGSRRHCLSITAKPPSTNQEAGKVHEHPHRGRQCFGRDLAVSGKGVDQSLINQLESIIIVFIKYQNQSMAADEKNG
jgi:hypothetical protein